jgi:hypothetical protein
MLNDLWWKSVHEPICVLYFFFRIFTLCVGNIFLFIDDQFRSNGDMSVSSLIKLSLSV